MVNSQPVTIASRPGAIFPLLTKPDKPNEVASPSNITLSNSNVLNIADPKSIFFAVVSEVIILVRAMLNIPKLEPDSVIPSSVIKDDLFITTAPILSNVPILVPAIDNINSRKQKLTPPTVS